MSTSVTPTTVAPLSEPEYQPQQGNATKGDVHQDQEVALDKPSPTPSPTLEGEADPNVVTWDSPDDPANPRNWSLRRKWFITILFSVTTFCATFSSSSPSSAAPFIAQEFNSSTEVSYLVTSAFLLGYVPSPIFWGPGSEMYGRRAVLIPALAAFTLFYLGQSLAQNMAAVLVTRFLCGFFACAPLNNCGGLLADLWDAATRVPASSLLFVSVFLGPELGPTVGGLIISSDAGWRWVFWVNMIFAGSCTVACFFFMPETYGPYILRKKAERLRKADPVKNKDLRAEGEVKFSPTALLEQTLFRPFKMLVEEPILVWVTIYVSMVYAVLYAQFEAFPIIFINHHGLTIRQNGLIFLGVGIGTSIGAIFDYLSQVNRYKVLIKEWRGFPPPEQRLYTAAAGGPLLVISSFWLGWTGAYTAVPWYVPGLSTIMFGASISMISMSFLNYLVDTYLTYAASAFAVNTMVRSAAGAGVSLFTTQMFNNLGIQWATTLIGLIGALLVPIPFIFLKYGARIRTHSRFAPCIDIEIAKQLAASKEERARESEAV